MNLNNNELQNFEKVPNDWSVFPLGEVLPISYGKGLTKAKRDESGKFPVYGSSGQVGVHSASLTKKPSLILGRKGSVGEVHYSKLPCWPIDTVYFAEEHEGLELRFFHYLLKGLNLAKLDKSTAVPGLSRDDYNAVEVAVAPLDQQKRIVAEIEEQFSRLDKAVTNLKRIKANLKRYKAAVEGKLTEAWRQAHPNVEPATKLFERILTERRAKWKGKGKYKEPEKPDISNLPELPQHWVWCLTDALFSFVTSRSRGWAQYYSDDGPLFLRMRNLDHESISLDLGDVQRVKPPAGTEGIRTKVEAGDILISITADVGMIAVVPSRLGDAYINQHVSLARPLNGFCREYLAWYLASHDGGQKMFLQLQRGATKVGLGLDDIRAVPVPFPPLAEQQEILAEIERRLSVIDELEATVKTNLTRADRLRQSILSQAFSGKLVSIDGEGNGQRSADIQLESA